jgi:hypothetical protein
MIPVVAVTNESTLVTDAQVMDLVSALQIQIDRDFSQAWHTDAKVIFWPKTDPLRAGASNTPPAGVWQLVILDNSDQAGALGYHDLTANGDPLGKAFVQDDITNGLQWSVTASHEMMEMLGDPWINLAAQAGSIMYAYEVCDACESDAYGYPIVIPNGKAVLVSDFVLPTWFQPGSNGPFDFKGHVPSPLALLPDGYISELNLSSGDGWTQVTGRFTSAARKKLSVPVVGSRRDRRKIGRMRWMRSTR